MDRNGERGDAGELHGFAVGIEQHAGDLIAVAGRQADCPVSSDADRSHRGLTTVLFVSSRSEGVSRGSGRVPSTPCPAVRRSPAD